MSPQRKVELMYGASSEWIYVNILDTKIETLFKLHSKL